MSSLDKVLRLASTPSTASIESEGAEFVRAAGQDLEELVRVLLADSDDDDDDSDEDDDEDEDDDDAPKGKKKPPWLGKKGSKKKVAATALILDAMVALSQLEGGEAVSLSVLTAAQRRKPSAHTIPGTEDYPIPDKGHLGAAVARYKQGKLAGHPEAVVRKHILSRAKALGETVDLVGPPAAGVVLALARGTLPSPPSVPMEHGPHTGVHSHPHRVVNVHEHEHYHNHDSSHRCGEGRMSSMEY